MTVGLEAGRSGAYVPTHPLGQGSSHARRDSDILSMFDERITRQYHTTSCKKGNQRTCPKMRFDSETVKRKMRGKDQISARLVRGMRNL